MVKNTLTVGRIEEGFVLDRKYYQKFRDRR